MKYKVMTFWDNVLNKLVSQIIGAGIISVVWYYVIMPHIIEKRMQDLALYQYSAKYDKMMIRDENHCLNKYELNYILHQTTKMFYE